MTSGQFRTLAMFFKWSTKICFKHVFAFSCSSPRTSSAPATVFTVTLLFQPSHFSLKLNLANQTDATQTIFINNDTIQIWRYTYLTKISNVSGWPSIDQVMSKESSNILFLPKSLPHLNIAPSPLLTFFL